MLNYDIPSKLFFENNNRSLCIINYVRNPGKYKKYR